MANFSLPILVYINHNQHLSFVLKYKTEGNEKTKNYWNIASCKLYLEGIRDLLNGGNYSYTHSYFTKKQMITSCFMSLPSIKTLCMLIIIR